MGGHGFQNKRNGLERSKYGAGCRTSTTRCGSNFLPGIQRRVLCEDTMSGDHDHADMQNTPVSRLWMALGPDRRLYVDAAPLDRGSRVRKMGFGDRLLR